MTKLQNDLEALGLRNGDSLLIHSAFSSLHRKISPKDFIDGVRDVLKNGTLLFPTLSWANVTKDDPVFDVNKTPCCTGFLPEFFRTSYEGAIRSIHPTHSCAAVSGSLFTVLTSVSYTAYPTISPFFTGVFVCLVAIIT